MNNLFRRAQTRFQDVLRDALQQILLAKPDNPLLMMKRYFEELRTSLEEEGRLEREAEGSEREYEKDGEKALEKEGVQVREEGDGEVSDEPFEESV